MQRKRFRLVPRASLRSALFLARRILTRPRASFAPPSKLDIGRFAGAALASSLPTLLGTVERTHLLLYETNNGRSREDIDQSRIELRPSPFSHGGERDLHASGVVIATRVRYRVERVGDRHNASRERNTLSPKSSRVPLAIASLVVRENSLTQIRIEYSEWSQNVCAPSWMRVNSAPLLGSELCCLVKDVGDGLVDRSDIMEERDPLNA